MEVVKTEQDDSGFVDPASIRDALAESRAAVLSLSPLGADSLQLREIAIATGWHLEAKRQGKEYAVIPVLMPGATVDSPPGLLAAFPPIDRTNVRGEEAAIESLIRGSTVKRAIWRRKRTNPIVACLRTGSSTHQCLPVVTMLPSCSELE